MSLLPHAVMSFRENVLLLSCVILFLLLVSYVGRYGAVPRFWNPWPEGLFKALSGEGAVLYSLAGVSCVPPVSPLSDHTMLGVVPLQTAAERQMVMQQMRRAGGFRRLAVKLLFRPKYGLRVQHADVVWEILFSEVQAVCFRDGKPGGLFWIDLDRTLLDLLLERHGVRLPPIA